MRLITNVGSFLFTITMELKFKGLEIFEVVMQMLMPNMWQEEIFFFFFGGQIFTFGNPPNLRALSSFNESVDITSASCELKNVAITTHILYQNHQQVLRAVHALWERLIQTGDCKQATKPISWPIQCLSLLLWHHGFTQI